MVKIYVGNLAFDTSETEIRELFGQHGTVHSAELVSDRDTGRPRGFGFIEMDQDGATKAISALDGREVDGRNLRVNQAREQGSRSRAPRQQRGAW